MFSNVWCVNSSVIILPKTCILQYKCAYCFYSFVTLTRLMISWILVYVHNFVLKMLLYRNYFDTVGYWKVCSMHPWTTFSDCRQLATSQNAEVDKIWGVLPIEGNSRDEIWRVSIDCGSALAHNIWPSLVKGDWYRSPQMSKFPRYCSFSSMEGDTINGLKWNWTCKHRSWVQIWPRSVKGVGTRAPKLWKFGWNCDISVVFCPALAVQYINPDEIMPVSIDH